MLEKDWVADGTADATPVTSSTPEVQVTTPAQTDAASATDSASSAPASASEAATQASADAQAAGATPAQAAEAGKQAAEDFIEGQYQDKPFKIPAGVRLPWKRGDEQGFATIEEIRRAHMFEKDYRVKTAQVAAERREALVEQRRSEARLKAQADWLSEQQDRQAKSFGDPEEEAKYQAFLEQYKRDPAFKKMVDDSREAAIVLAEQGAMQDIEAHEALVTETENVLTAIHDIGQKYPGVDPDAIRQSYSQALIANTLPLSRAAIESLYEQEAQAISRITAPLQTDLAALRAELAELRKEKQSQAHNEKTRTAIDRARNPVGAPQGGNPPAPVPPSTQLKEKTLPARSREWAAIR